MLGKVVIIGVLLTIVGLVVMKAIDPNLESNGNGGGISIDGSLTGSDTITVGITGDVVSPNNYTLDEGATMADLIEQNKSQNTIDNYIRNIESFKKWYKDTTNEELRLLYRPNVLDYKSYLRNIKKTRNRTTFKSRINKRKLVSTCKI